VLPRITSISPIAVRAPSPSHSRSHSHSHSQQACGGGGGGGGACILVWGHNLAAGRLLVRAAGESLPLPWPWLQIVFLRWQAGFAEPDRSLQCDLLLSACLPALLLAACAGQYPLVEILSSSGAAASSSGSSADSAGRAFAQAGEAGEWVELRCAPAAACCSAGALCFALPSRFLLWLLPALQDSY
jgi:hypothetical protein